MNLQVLQVRVKGRSEGRLGSQCEGSRASHDADVQLLQPQVPPNTTCFSEPSLSRAAQALAAELQVTSVTKTTECESQSQWFSVHAQQVTRGFYKCRSPEIRLVQSWRLNCFWRPFPSPKMQRPQLCATRARCPQRDAQLRRCRLKRAPEATAVPGGARPCKERFRTVWASMRRLMSPGTDQKLTELGVFLSLSFQPQHLLQAAQNLGLGDRLGSAPTTAPKKTG